VHKDVTFNPCHSDTSGGTQTHQLGSLAKTPPRDSGTFEPEPQQEQVGPSKGAQPTRASVTTSPSSPRRGVRMDYKFRQACHGCGDYESRDAPRIPRRAPREV
jgi:hypothetical protein